MASVAIVVSLLLVLLFVGLSLPENGLFKLHPSSMALGYLGCMFNAIYIFSTDHSTRLQFLTRRKQILIHSLLQFATVLCAIIGFTSIYLNKQQRKKPHFTSWHGLVGLIVFVWSLLQAVAGLFLTVLQRYIRSVGLTYAQLRLYHATSGVLLFTISCLSLVLGLASNWFKTKMPNNTIVYSVIFYFLASSTLFLAHKCVEQVKNRYVRRTR